MKVHYMSDKHTWETPQEFFDLLNEEEFLEYALDNKLTVTPRYIDNIADLSNGKMIKASYGGIMIGTTNISKQVFALNEGEIK